MNSSVDMARIVYDELGFDTLPLIPGAKKAYARAWNIRLPHRLWQNAPERANIGIRGGGIANLAFLDCDEPRTFNNVTNWLAGLGYRGDSYPLIQTSSGEGRHIYITLATALSGDVCKLSREVGAGEFRYGAGAYVVAPPSSTRHGGYSLISGDYSIRPSLEVKDILPLLANHVGTSTRKPTLSRKALALLHGKGTEKYSSRSEAEQSLLASMANAGFAFEDVLDMFNRNPCAGKYTELKTKNARNAERWLFRSYKEAQEWVSAHESQARQIAKMAIVWAESRAWKGRTGAVDQLTFLAHANIAYRAGRLTYAASCRDLAERAGISHMTATRATWRLCKSGLLVPDRKAVADSANIFELLNRDMPLHSPSTPVVRKCNTTSNHDVFRHRGLGKSAGQVWQVLQESPARIDQLVERTGRHPKTIKRALDQMSKITDPLTGECLPMVFSENGEVYYPLSVELDRIAHAVGTAGAGERQQKKHAQERRIHARALANSGAIKKV
jgi:hypothetical protein